MCINDIYSYKFLQIPETYIQKKFNLFNELTDPSASVINRYGCDIYKQKVDYGNKTNNT